MRRIGLAFLALLAGTLGGFVVASPAQAGPGDLHVEQYIAITPYGEKLHYWFWIDEMEGIIGCPKCLHWFDFDKSEQLRVEQELGFSDGVMTGLEQLGRANAATDPRTRSAWRAGALGHFTAAARALRDARLRSGPVGYYDPDRDVTVATESRWLSAADQDIVDGISLLQQSFEGPTPQPWIEAAVVQFDEAFQEISTKQSIGG